MVLVKRRPEGSATSGGAGGLLTNTRADSSAAHQVRNLVILGISSSCTDSPRNYSNGADQNGTTDAYDDTNDNPLLV
jgi:hypothetical protein